MNPNSLSNLRPFRPGQSGNPSGRPRRCSFTAEFERQLEMPLPESVRRKLGLPWGASYAQGLVKALIDRAIRGDTAAAREITDRVEGKAVARLEHAGSEGAPGEANQEEVHAKLRRLLGLT